MVEIRNFQEAPWSSRTFNTKTIRCLETWESDYLLKLPHIKRESLTHVLHKWVYRS